MTNLPQIPERLLLHGSDGREKPIDPVFMPEEELFRGYTLLNVDDGGMAGISFRFDPHCSFNRGKYSEWTDMLIERPYSGVLALTVSDIPMQCEVESEQYQAHLEHEPDSDVPNYSHSSLVLPFGGVQVGRKTGQKIRKSWRILLDEKLGVTIDDPDAWKKYSKKWPDEKPTLQS